MTTESGRSIDQLRCRVARTALLLPFQWERRLRARPSEVVGEIGARQYVPRRSRAEDGTLRQRPFWDDRSPKEVSEVDELAPAFKALLQSEKGSPDPLAWRRLQLHSDVLDSILGGPVLHSRKGQSFEGFEISEVEIVTFPLGTGVVIVHIDWMPTVATSLTVGGLRSRLYLARHARFVPDKDDVCGWTLRGRPLRASEHAPSSELPDEHVACLGPALIGARYHDHLIGLQDLVGSLLLGPVDEGEIVALFQGSRYAMHHSSVVLETEPSPEEWALLSFHLRRAYELEYRPAQVSLSDVDYAPRANRHIGVSREGAVSISYVPDGVSETFELVDWPQQKFQRFYLLLRLHAVAEQLALAQLSHRAAMKALEFDSPGTLVALRPGMDALLRDMVRYTLTLTGEDCGGLTDSTDFFSVVRRVHRIEEQREELRREIQELASLVQVAHLDAQQKRQKAEAAREFAFQRRIGWLAAVFGPLTVVTGILGINLPLDEMIPGWTPWRAAGVSVAIIGLVFLVIYFCLVRTVKADDGEERSETVQPLEGSTLPVRESGR